MLYSRSHFECSGHTVHMLTQRRRPPSLTSTVKSSLFTHVHSSPLSLSARLHGCHANCSHCVNNDWTFSKHLVYVSVCIHFLSLYIILFRYHGIYMYANICMYACVYIDIKIYMNIISIPIYPFITYTSFQAELIVIYLNLSNY